MWFLLDFLTKLSEAICFLGWTKHCHGLLLYDLWNVFITDKCILDILLLKCSLYRKYAVPYKTGGALKS